MNLKTSILYTLESNVPYSRELRVYFYTGVFHLVLSKGKGGLNTKQKITRKTHKPPAVDSHKNANNLDFNSDVD